MILNSVFKDVVVVKSDEQFVGCEFASGSVAKQKGVFGLSIEGAANVTVKDCEFKNKGYSAIFMNSTGKINIEDNKIDCAGLYNPIEGNPSADGAKLDKVLIKGNKLEGICGNNHINFYNLKDNAVIDIKDNIIVGSKQESEPIRLSNVGNTNATFNVEGNKYSFDLNTDFNQDYTSFIMCQDYTGNKAQDFSKFTINIKDLECQGQPVTSASNVSVGKLCFTYENKKGIITDNNPVINFI